MGLFGLFGSKEEREKGALRKLAKRLTERYGPPENRQKAISQLGDLGTPEALETLCLRFTVRVEPGITDDDEKETTRGILVDAREAAIGPIEKFVAGQEDGIAWGLRALADVAPATKVREVALRELARLGRTYTRDPEKKLVLLKWLAEHHAGVGRPRGRGGAPAAARGLLRRRPHQRDARPRGARPRRARARRAHPAPPARPRQRPRSRRGPRRARRRSAPT